MNSLNQHTALEIKNEISQILKYDISNIKLYGPRISGFYDSTFALEVAILDKNKTKTNEKMVVFDLNICVNYTDSLNYDWLNESI